MVYFNVSKVVYINIYSHILRYYRLDDTCLNKWDQIYAICYIWTMINSLWPNDTIWHHRTWSTLVQVNGLVPDDTMPLPEPMMTNYQWDHVSFMWVQFHRKCSRYLSSIWVWKLLSQITVATPRDQWVKPMSYWKIQWDSIGPAF